MRTIFFVAALMATMVVKAQEPGQLIVMDTCFWVHHVDTITTNVVFADSLGIVRYEKDTRIVKSWKEQKCMYSSIAINEFRRNEFLQRCLDVPCETILFLINE